MCDWIHTWEIKLNMFVDSWNIGHVGHLKYVQRDVRDVFWSHRMSKNFTLALVVGVGNQGLNFGGGQWWPIHCQADSETGRVKSLMVQAKHQSP